MAGCIGSHLVIGRALNIISSYQGYDVTPLNIMSQLHIISAVELIFITYLLRLRETVCFVDPRPPVEGPQNTLFPEVSVNKCFII